MSEISYIVGIGRSGTTLLSNLLNNHQNIHSTPEAVFLVFFLNKFKSKNINIFDLQLILKQIETYGLSHPWVGWHFDKNNLIKDFEFYATHNKFVSYHDTVKIIYKNFKSNNLKFKKIEYILDKNPSYSLYLDKLKVFSPNSLYIIMFRDYRANVLSRKQSVYLKSPNVAYNAYRWRIFNKKLLNFHGSYKNKSMILKYEDLIAESDLSLNKTYSFLKLDTNNILSKTEFKTQLDTTNIPEKYKDRYIKKYSDLNKKVNTSRMNSWKEELSEKEVKICDVFCASIGEKLGYIPKNKFNTFQKFYYHCRYIFPISKAVFEVYKDYLIYYLPPAFKIKKLTQQYKKNGFIK